MPTMLEVLFTPAEYEALSGHDLSQTVCVVFDVFRATTTIVTALANGAAAIIPVAEIGSLAHIRLYPEGTKRYDGGRFEKYREAWDLLRRGAARPREA